VNTPEEALPDAVHLSDRALQEIYKAGIHPEDSFEGICGQLEKTPWEKRKALYQSLKEIGVSLQSSAATGALAGVSLVMGALGGLCTWGAIADLTGKVDTSLSVDQLLFTCAAYAFFAVGAASLTRHEWKGRYIKSISVSLFTRQLSELSYKELHQLLAHASCPKDSKRIIISEVRRRERREPQLVHDQPSFKALLLSENFICGENTSVLSDGSPIRGGSPSRAGAAI
jgi:hypothetical protein